MPHRATFCLVVPVLEPYTVAASRNGVFTNWERLAGRLPRRRPDLICIKVQSPTHPYLSCLAIAASMSLINVVSVELPKYEEALPQWKDALSACVGRVSTSLKDQESTHCVPVGVRPFSGRIECAALGDIILAKLMATANHFQRSLLTETPTLPVPVLLFIQLSGSNRFDQHEEVAWYFQIILHDVFKCF